MADIYLQLSNVPWGVGGGWHIKQTVFSDAIHPADICLSAREPTPLLFPPTQKAANILILNGAFQNTSRQGPRVRQFPLSRQGSSDGSWFRRLA